MPKGRPRKDRALTEDPTAYWSAAVVLEEADKALEDAKITNSGAWKDAVADYEIDPSILKRVMKIWRQLNSNRVEVRDKARDYLRQEQLCREGLGINRQMDMFDQDAERERQSEHQEKASSISPAA